MACVLFLLFLSVDTKHQTVVLDELNAAIWRDLEIYRTQHKNFYCFPGSHNLLLAQYS